MNSFLLSIGIAIAAALIAALVAPFFIDWGGYRSFFEFRASELFGAPVKIEGDLSARLLPRPRIEASNVTIGDGSFHAEGLQICLGLTPLMSGNLQVEHVRVTGAEVRVAADGAGRISGLERPGPQESTDDFTLDSIEIADGRLIVTGKGGEKIFDGVNLKASATNLDGPYKAEGSLRHDGETYDVSFATGRWSDDGDLRTKLSVTPRAQPVTFDMDGMARIDEGTPAFSGRVRLERIADANAPGSRWLFRGDTDANPANVRFTAMTLGFGPAERQFTLEGAGSLALGDHPRFDAVLGARQADLDRALGDGEEGQASLSDVLTRIGEFSRKPPPIPGRLGIDLARVVVGGNLVDDVSLEVSWDGDQWRVGEASASLPGNTSIGLAGDLVPADADNPPIFNGAVRIATSRGQVFADWLGADLKPYTGWLAGAVDGRADLAVGNGHMGLDNIALSLDGRPLNGSVSVDFPDAGDNGLVAIDLAGQQIRIEALQALWAGLKPGEGKAADSTPDVSLKLETDVLSAGAVNARGVAIEAHLVDGELDLRQLRVGDLGGAQVQASGVLGLAGDRSDGTLDFLLEARALDDAASFLDLMEFHQVAAALEKRAGALAPLSLKGQLRTGAVAGGRTGLSLEGSAAGTTISATGSIGGVLTDLAQADIDADIRLVAENAGELISQIGLPAGPVADGAAGVELSLRGTPRDGLGIDADVTGLESDLKAQGSVRFDADGARTLDLDVRASSAELVRFLAAFDLVAPRIGETPLKGLASVKIEGRDPFKLNNITLAFGDHAAPVKISGNGTLALGRNGRAHRIDAELSGDTLSLPGLLDVLFGAGRFVQADGAEFSAEPFAVSLPERVEIDAGLETDRLRLVPGLELTGAKTKLTLRSDGLRLEGIEGGAFGGKAHGALSLSAQSGNVTADGRMRIEGGRFEDMVWKRGGRAVASGTINADLTFAGSGRSLSAIVSSLTGEGAVSIADGSIAGLSPVAFDRIVDAADRGAEIDEDKAEELLAAYLDLGALDFDRADMTFSVAGGVARATRFAIDGDGLSSFVTGQADLNKLTLNSAWSVRAPPDPEAPDQVKEFGIVFSGPLDDPQRSFDTAPLISYLTIRAFEHEVQRLEEVQLDIHDRGRIQRELDVLVNCRLETRRAAEADRQRKARAAAARRAREEAERKAAEEAAAQAAAEAAARAAAQEAFTPPPLPSPSAPPPAVSSTQPAPALNAPIEIAPPPGLAPPVSGQVSADSRDPLIPQNLADDGNLPQPLPGVQGELELPPEPPARAPVQRKRPKTDPMAGFNR